MTSRQLLWPEGHPSRTCRNKDKAPAITPYWPPPETANGAAVVVCPGGGYGVLFDHEGEPIARWLNTLGVAAFVLHSRLTPNVHPAMLHDAARSVRTIRANAAEWKIDPNRIGMIGFSAGGHLITTLAAQSDAGDLDAHDPVDRVSSRPDFLIPIYPVITLEGPHANLGTRDALLGASPSPALLRLLSSHLQVTPETPPAFLVHSIDDEIVSVENSLLMARALRAAGVPFELHVYGHGGHGYALAAGDPVLSTWPALCAAWLKARGFLNPDHASL